MAWSRAVGLAGGRWLAAAASLLALATAAMAGGQAQAAPHPVGPDAAAGVIATIAGGPGGPARATKVAIMTCGLSSSGEGLYLPAYSTVQLLNPQTGWLTTPVGGTPEQARGRPYGSGGPAAYASLDSACATAVDPAGNLLIADGFHNLLRVVAHASGTFYGQAMTVGHIYTVAGDGRQGLTVNGTPATQTPLQHPQGVAVDAAGNVVITSHNGYVHVLAENTGTYYGQSMTAGDLYNVAGGGTTLGDGGPATKAMLDTPAGVAVDSHGNLLIADSGDNRVRVVAQTDGTFYGVAMTAGNIYTVAGNGVGGYSGDGGPATSAELDFPDGVAVDAAGNLLLTDTSNNRVRVVAASTGTFYGQSMTTGDIYTIAGDGTSGFTGDGGPATAAELFEPGSLSVDSAGNVLVLCENRVRVVAASSGTFYNQAMTAGDIYNIAGNGKFYSGNRGLTRAAVLFDPEGVAVDSHGNLIIANTLANEIWVSAALPGKFYGVVMTAKHIYDVAGTGQPGSSGAGGPATDAELHGPEVVALDSHGNLIIANTAANEIQVVAASDGTFYGRAMIAGSIYTIAGTGTKGFSGDGGPATSAELDYPEGVGVDAAGNVLIADSFNNRVRVVAANSGTFYGQSMTAGDIYTIAGTGAKGFSGDGGPGTSAELNTPASVAVDSHGNVLIADLGNDRVRVVAASTGSFYGQSMTAGNIYTIAGGGDSGLGDGGPATSAELNTPTGVTVDAAGNVVIADSGDSRIRVVAQGNGTFYGVPMSTGDIYTVAGDGRFGYYGDNRLAINAELNAPSAVAVNQVGDLLIADSGNNRVRMVTG
jgi:trimeric autotransporter adhesin